MQPPAHHTSPGALLGYQVRYRAVSLPGQPSLSALPAPAAPMSAPDLLDRHAHGQALAAALPPLPALDEADGGAPWVSRTVRGVAGSGPGGHGGPGGLGGPGGPRQEVVLLGLQSFTRYEVTVRAFNEVGTGPTSLPIIATTMEGGEYDSDTPST